MTRKLLTNLLLYIGTFLFFYWYKKGFVLNEYFVSHLSVYLGSWGGAALLSRKFKSQEKHEFFSNLYPYLVSFALMLGLLAAYTILFQQYEVSHHIIISSLLSAFIFEAVYIFYISRFNLGLGRNKKLIISRKTMIIDLVVLVWVIILTIYLRMGTDYSLREKEIIFLLSMIIAWFISGVIGHQFPPYEARMGYWRYAWGYLKAYTLFMALSSFTVFLMRMPVEEYVQLLGGSALYTVWSFIVITYNYIDKKQGKTDEVDVRFLRSNTLIEETDSRFETSVKNKYGLQKKFEERNNTLPFQLKDVYLKKMRRLYNFLDSSLLLNTFDLSNSITLRTSDSYNIRVLPEEQMEFIINLHEINDFRRINAFFIEINKKLVNGGVFIGRLKPNKFRRRRFLKSYPYYLAQIFYFFDFLWKRVVPKLPIVKKIYFELTKGKDRAISLAEGLGRLYYCGFEIIATTEIEEFVYFIVKKVKEPLKDTNPSYGPLFKMKRLGKNGGTIYVYKMRTMHPFSEYLQKYIYERNSLKEGGKILDDFRITTWGKIFRELWIDELPMIINLIKGDLKIVGVRPLSQHFMSLYTEELKMKRIKTKPGLIPPFYADMPKTLPEIMDSEWRYLEAYEKHPVITDLQYFIKSAYNILIKKARSG